MLRRGRADGAPCWGVWLRTLAALSLLGQVPPGADGEVPLLGDVFGRHRYALTLSFFVFFFFQKEKEKRHPGCAKMNINKMRFNRDRLRILDHEKKEKEERNQERNLRLTNPNFLPTNCNLSNNAIQHLKGIKNPPVETVQTRLSHG